MNDNDENADLIWDYYCSRNKSIIQENMHGQFKSCIKCLNCNNYSYTYDIFNILQLPIVSLSLKTIDFVFIPYDIGEVCINYRNRVNLENNICDFYNKVHFLTGASEFIMAL